MAALFGVDATGCVVTGGASHLAETPVVRRAETRKAVKFHMSLRFHCWTTTARGIYGIIFLGVLLSLPYLFSSSLTPEDAKRGIREYLLWKLSQQQLAELKSSGMRVPDTRMALRWKEQTEQVHDTEFLSLEVKRALLVPPLRKRTNFVVRAVIRDTKQQTQTRYFWVNGLISVLNVRESSKLAWHLPI